MTTSRRGSTNEEAQTDFMMSPMEVARWLGIGRTKVYEILSAPGGIVSYRIGRRRVVPKDAVLEWLREQEHGPGAGRS